MASKVLDALMVTLPMMQQFFGIDVQICLCDREKTIGVWYGKTFRMDIQVGEYFDKSKPGHGEMLAAMASGKESVSVLPEFVYGVPVRGIITPIKENGEVVGVISCAVSIKEQAEMERAAENLNDNLSNTYASSNEIAQGAKQLADEMDMVKIHSQSIHELVEATSVIVKSIQNNASRSNMLALNASIEAARSGERGKGFAVVAQEMGKLAKMSGDATSAISEKLQNIFSQLKEISDEISNTADIATAQAANVEEIAERLEAIERSAQMLAQAAKQ